MSTSAGSQPRQPRGVPTGGQWRVTPRPEGPVLCEPRAVPAAAGTGRLGQVVREVLHSSAAFAILDLHPATKDSDFGQGGCKVAALALHSILPGSEVHAIKFAGSDAPRHLVVFYRGKYLDRDGAQSERKLLDTASQDWFVDRSQLSVGPVTDEDIERSEAPDPVDEATGERLSKKLAGLLRREVR